MWGKITIALVIGYVISFVSIAYYDVEICDCEFWEILKYGIILTGGFIVAFGFTYWKALNE